LVLAGKLIVGMFRMSREYKFYEAKGYHGYIHAECWFAFEAANAKRDAQGRIVSKPVLASAMRSIGKRASKRPCVHCHEPLVPKQSQPISQTESGGGV